MSAYIAMWKNYFNFSDRTTRRDFWFATLFAALVSGVISFIAYSSGMEWIVSIYGLAATIPAWSIAVRRLRDVGKGWVWIFISCIPLIGWIWYLILLCKPSIEADGTPVV